MSVLSTWQRTPSSTILRALRHFSTTTRAAADLQRHMVQRPLSQPTAFTHGYLMSASDVTPGISRAEYVQRRRHLAAALPPRSLCLFPSNPQRYMSEDVPYFYHHNTDLMYICGITEPGSLLAVEKGNGPDALYTLFVSRRDASRELWDGPQCGDGEEVRAYFGVDAVRTTEELSRYCAHALSGLDSFHFDSEVNPSVSAMLQDLNSSVRRRLAAKWNRKESPKTFLLPQRLIKSPAEQALLRQAAQIMSSALNETMARAHLSPDSESVDEKYIEALIEFGCKRQGSDRLAFPSVVASGTNGTILHYMNNNCAALAGDFVMVDAGCEVHGYCSDVSRSWPVSGRFTGAQRDIYELVLSVQKKCITLASENARFGKQPVTMDRMHFLAVRDLTAGLLHLGFMKGHSLESAISTGAYTRYFPHSTGHYLGMDVHDTHQLPKSLPLQRGMVVTVEPGLYCPIDDVSAPEAFRGLGMRIEDDVLVGGGDMPLDVLSKDALKEISEIEGIVGTDR